MRNDRRGFALIEALVAAFLVAVGITATTMTLGAMSKAQVRLRQTDEMQRLAIQTLDDIIAGGGLTGGSESGNYAYIGETRYAWQAEEVSAGRGNLDTIQVRVTQVDDPQGRAVEVDSLYCRPPSAKSGKGSGGTAP
jgi:type II secretory pathway pseudopilin PulG